MITGGDKNDVGHQHDSGSAGARHGPSRALAGRHRPGGPGARSRGPGDPTTGPRGRHPGRAGAAGDGEHRHPRRIKCLHCVRDPGARGCCGGRSCHRGRCGNQRARSQPERRAASTRGRTSAAPAQPRQPGWTLDAGRWRSGLFRRGSGHQLRRSVRGIERHPSRFVAEVRRSGIWLDPQDLGVDQVRADWVRRRQAPARTRRVGIEGVGSGSEEGSGQAQVGIGTPRVRIGRVRIEAQQVRIGSGSEVGIGRVWRLAEVQADRSQAERIGPDPDPEPVQQAGSAQPGPPGDRTPTRDRTPVQARWPDQPG